MRLIIAAKWFEYLIVKISYIRRVFPQVRALTTQSIRRCKSEMQQSGESVNGSAQSEKRSGQVSTLQNFFLGGGKPTLLTSVNISINIRISIVPWGTGCIVNRCRRKNTDVSRVVFRTLLFLLHHHGWSGKISQRTFPIVSAKPLKPSLMFAGKSKSPPREALLKGKAQYSWPPCTN